MKLTTKAKIIISALVAGGVTFGIVKLVKSVKKNEPKREGEKLVQDDLTNWDPTVRRLSDAKCKEIAETLYELMDKTFRQEDAIVDLILDSGMTYMDLKKVYEDFGVREYGTFGSPFWGSGTMKNLVQWLKEEVDGDELDKIKGMFTSAGYSWV